MPEVVGLRLAMSAELGPEAEMLDESHQRVTEVEAEPTIAAERQRTGQGVYGRCAVDIR